jgi:hypothetical protein
VQFGDLYRRSMACTPRSSRKSPAELPAKVGAGLVDWERVGEMGTARRGGEEEEEEEEEWSRRANSHKAEVGGGVKGACRRVAEVLVLSIATT